MQQSRCQCPTCKFAFRFEDRFLGRVTSCPKCTQKIRLASIPANPSAVETPTPDTSNPFLPTATPGRGSGSGQAAGGRRAAPRDYLAESDPSIPGLDPLADRAAAKQAARRVVRQKLSKPAPTTEMSQQKKQDFRLKLLGAGIAISLGLIGWGVFTFFFADDSKPDIAAEWVDPNEDQFRALQSGTAAGTESDAPDATDAPETDSPETGSTSPTATVTRTSHQPTAAAVAEDAKKK